MQITITIPKLTTILGHWKWGLLAALMFAFTLTSGGSVGAPSVEAGTQTEMSLDAANHDPGDTGLQSCDLPSKPTKCEATVGEQFDIIVDVNAITSAYDIIFTEINVGGLIFKPGFGGTDCAVNGAIKEVIWPAYQNIAGNCNFTDDSGVSGNVGVFAYSNGVKSIFLGPIVKFNVACPATPGSHKVTLVANAAALFTGTSLLNLATSVDQFPKESVPGLEVDSLKINCAPAQQVEMSLDAANHDPGDTGLQSCDLPSKPTKCEATVGEQFDIIVDVNKIKAGYDRVTVEINPGGLIFKPGATCEKEVLWPDYGGGSTNCVILDDTGLSGNVAHSAFLKAGKSTFLGPVVKFNVACPATPGSHKVTLVPLGVAAVIGTSLFNSITGDGWQPVELVPGLEVDSLKINCVPRVGMALKAPATVEVGSKFIVTISGNPVPEKGSPGFMGFIAEVQVSAGLKYNGTKDCPSELKATVQGGAPPQVCISDNPAAGTHAIAVLSQIGVPPLPEMDASGPNEDLANFSYQCNSLGTQTITLLTVAQSPTAGSAYFDPNVLEIPVKTKVGDNADQITIDCGDVGGIAELPEVADTPLEAAGSSGSNTALIAGIVAGIAAGTVAMSGAAWYARRRR